MPFGVRSSNVFDRQVQLYAGNMERWDDMWRSTEFVLANDPYKAGNIIPGTQLYALRFKNDPNVTIYYYPEYEPGLVYLVRLSYDSK